MAHLEAEQREPLERGLSFYPGRTLPPGLDMDNGRAAWNHLKGTCAVRLLGGCVTQPEGCPTEAQAEGGDAQVEEGMVQWKDLCGNHKSVPRREDQLLCICRPRAPRADNNAPPSEDYILPFH